MGRETQRGFRPVCRVFVPVAGSVPASEKIMIFSLASQTKQEVLYPWTHTAHLRVIHAPHLVSIYGRLPWPMQCEAVPHIFRSNSELVVAELCCASPKSDKHTKQNCNSMSVHTEKLLHSLRSSLVHACAQSLPTRTKLLLSKNTLCKLDLAPGKSFYFHIDMFSTFRCCILA
jgi:hypothetical protein